MRMAIILNNLIRLNVYENLIDSNSTLPNDFSAFAGKPAGEIIRFSSMDTILPKDGLQPSTKDDEARLRNAGFRWGQRGTHTSRTIMLDELRAVLTNCRPDARRNSFLSASRPPCRRGRPGPMRCHSNSPA